MNHYIGNLKNIIIIIIIIIITFQIMDQVMVNQEKGIQEFFLGEFSLRNQWEQQ